MTGMWYGEILSYLSVLLLDSILLSKKIIFIRVLVIKLHLQLLARGLVDNELHTNKETVE